jgi:hypothetical protein
LVIGLVVVKKGQLTISVSAAKIYRQKQKKRINRKEELWNGVRLVAP